MGNNTLGTNDGHGALNPIATPLHPAIGPAATSRACSRSGPTGPPPAPPGHWNSIARCDGQPLARRLGGTGPIVDLLEWT
jgi:hypothetical protein